MSAVQEEQQTEAPARGLLHREFQVADVAVEGRTIDALCVPFNTPATVADAPHFEPYKEMFVKGAFARALKAPFRVWLNFEHGDGLSNVIGNGIKFEERDDGLYGELEIDDGEAGNKALRFIHKNILRSLSVEFKPMSRDEPNADGIVERRSVHLDAVALCRKGAYADAKVLAVREDPILAEELRPLDLNPELVERCRRLGIELPQRYQAHPAEDTPAETGTPETAPAETETTTESEE